MYTMQISSELIKKIPFVSLAILVLVIGIFTPRGLQASFQTSSPTRRVNVPNLSGAEFTPAIFWFGQVDPTSNYTDVRVWHYDEQLVIMLNMIDRLVWEDTTPSELDLTEWDAVSLYLDMGGNTNVVPSTNAYLIQSQISYHTGFRWNGTAWESIPFPGTIETTWRGNYPNDSIDDKGWQVTFTLPFSDLGLYGPPATGTSWGLAVVVHDRDDAGGSFIPDQTWPDNLDTSSPATWGELKFGVPSYTPPPVAPGGETIIRQGVSNAQVVDGHVGGHTTCGADVDHWTQWGEANFAGFTQINIQNQWDISDWPCFSKYYVTFPLDSLPPGKVIISASLTLTLFGNAGGGVWGEPPDSYIEVLTVGEDWGETTLTWNNAPLPAENFSGTWVYPRDYNLPDQPYHWDVSQAVNESYLNGTPLRLALYSPDGERHSGKYFWTSEVDEWIADYRPTLKVVWGVLCDSPDIECNFTYMPMLTK